MSEIEELIKTTQALSNRLSNMADDERKFGWSMCHMMEQISWDLAKTSNELKEIKSYMGVV